MSDPHSTCFKCGKEPYEIQEYIDGAAEDWVPSGEEHMSPWEWMRREEGTYNPATNHFCCTDCYIKIGMPSSEKGWVAP